MIPDQETRQLIARQAVRTPLDIYQSLAWRLWGEGESSAERLRAGSFLERLSPAITVILKRLVEAGEIEAYRNALRDWAEVRRRSRRESELEDIRLERDHAQGAARRELDRKLAAAEPIADATEAVERERASSLLQLGGWLARQARQTESRREALREYLEPLVAEADRELILAVLAQYFRAHEFGLLERWHSEEMMDAGVSSWSGDRSSDGLYWAALLLLRMVRPDSELVVEPASNAAWAGQQMSSHLQAVIADRELWKPFLPHEDLDQRHVTIESAWTRAADSYEESERRRIAEADLSAERVRGFREGNQAAYVETPTLARALAREGRLARTYQPEAFDEHARVIRQLLPKEWFVDEESVIGLGENLGRDMARDQDDVLIGELERAVPASNRVSGPIEIGRIPAHIRDWAENHGRAPLVLAPDHYRLRQELFVQEGFERATESDGALFGRLADAEILLVGTDESRPLLLIDPMSVLLTEYTADADLQPLRVLVELVDEELARSSVERGSRSAGEADLTDAERIRKLMRERVLVDVRTAFAVEFDAATAVLLKWDSSPDEL